MCVLNNRSLCWNAAYTADISSSIYLRILRETQYYPSFGQYTGIQKKVAETYKLNAS